MPARAEFKRIVLGLHENTVPLAALRLAAAIAAPLRLDLLGLYLTDENALRAASLPFARELRLFRREWSPLDVGQLAQELDLAARNAERLFNEAVKTLPVASRFEVLRLSAWEKAVAREGDLVIVAEPRSPAGRLAQPFGHFVEAVFRCGAAIMLVPGRPVRERGAIVAIAASPDDPSAAVAATIAAAADRSFVLLEAYEDAVRSAAAGATALEALVDRLSAGEFRLPGVRLSQPAGALEAGLIVLTGAAVTPGLVATLSRIASLQQAPVLLVPSTGKRDRTASAPERR